LGEGKLEVAELSLEARHPAHEHALRLGGEIFAAKVGVHGRDDIAEESGPSRSTIDAGQQNSAVGQA
jgi:hypothetical protein